MTDESSVSELRAFVSSLELVISSLVVTHHDKAQLASRLTEMAHLIHANGEDSSRDAKYETVMSFAHLAQDALGKEYRRAK